MMASRIQDMWRSTTGTEINKDPSIFVTNLLDRFAMLMSSASRRNRYVSIAFGGSGARLFIDALQSGEFDYVKPQPSAASWRDKTCRDVRLRLDEH